MSIKYAILGILSRQPQSGYDLKKIMADSEALYWSGNNNQIYRTLSDLLTEGLVSKEVQLQEKQPAKGIYTISEAGRADLKQWVLTAPEAPESRNTFLIRLLGAGGLDDAEFGALLQQYEHEVHVKLLMQREKARRSAGGPGGTAREAHLWQVVAENIIGFYEQELQWIGRLRKELGAVSQPPRTEPPNEKVVKIL